MATEAPYRKRLYLILLGRHLHRQFVALRNHWDGGHCCRKLSVQLLKSTGAIWLCNIPAQPP
eukprot:1203565-Amphidinium_carterae.1